MPSPHTFDIPPIRALVERWMARCPGVWADPFCGRSKLAQLRNDLDPAHGAGGQTAEDWLATLTGPLDGFLFDPPYSPRQIVDCYKGIGLAVSLRETQTGRLYKSVKQAAARLLRPGGVAISFGWNSAGIGKTLGFEQVEILLVAHGGPHNDTIVTVERKASR